MTQLFSDYADRRIRLTDERLQHFVARLERIGLFDQIGETLLDPDVVRVSKTDPSVRLYYRRYASSKTGDKYLCIVVKLSDSDAFVLTGYATHVIKEGLESWKRI